jgi:hypothetical protein
MRKKRYELHLQLKYKGETSWVYYNRYRTYEGAVAALESRNGVFGKDITIEMAKIRDAEDGSVSFYGGQDE